MHTARLFALFFIWFPSFQNPTGFTKSIANSSSTVVPWAKLWGSCKTAKMVRTLLFHLLLPHNRALVLYDTDSTKREFFYFFLYLRQTTTLTNRRLFLPLFLARKDHREIQREREVSLYACATCFHSMYENASKKKRDRTGVSENTRLWKRFLCSRASKQRKIRKSTR